MNLPHKLTAGNREHDFLLNEFIKSNVKDGQLFFPDIIRPDSIWIKDGKVIFIESQDKYMTDATIRDKYQKHKNYCDEIIFITSRQNWQHNTCSIQHHSTLYKEWRKEAEKVIKELNLNQKPQVSIVLVDNKNWVCDSIDKDEPKNLSFYVDEIKPV